MPQEVLVCHHRVWNQVRVVDHCKLRLRQIIQCTALRIFQWKVLSTYFREQRILRACSSQKLLSLGLTGDCQCCPSGTVQYIYIILYHIIRYCACNIWSFIEQSQSKARNTVGYISTKKFRKDRLTSFGCFSMNFCVPWVWRTIEL